MSRYFKYRYRDSPKYLIPPDPGESRARIFKMLENLTTSIVFSGHILYYKYDVFEGLLWSVRRLIAEARLVGLHDINHRAECHSWELECHCL